MSLLITYFLLALTVSFLCSLLEAVILSLSHAHIALLIEEGRSSGLLLKRLKDKIDHPLSAILTLNTVANTVGAAGVGAQALEVFGSSYVAVFSALLTFAILVFSEIIPKTLGAVYWKRLASPAGYVIRGMIFLTYPFVIAFEFLGRAISPKGKIVKITREEMMMVAEMGREDGELLDRERRVIRNMLLLKNTTVKDHMTPRLVMFALPQDRSVGETIKEMIQLRFSRIPVYGKDLDDIIGLVRRYEINRAFSQGRVDQPLSELIEPIRVVPGSKPMDDALDEFITRREHLFLVVDEYGGTAGIITLEDAIEALLGVEIVDELDSVDDMQQYALERWERKRKIRELGVQDRPSGETSGSEPGPESRDGENGG